MSHDICQSATIVDKVRKDDRYAQNLYAALCNTEWQEQDVMEILRDRTWSCTWRYAGRIVADIRGQGDYTDWYCSGMMRSHPDDDLGSDPRLRIDPMPEGEITDEIREDLLAIGWREVS